MAKGLIGAVRRVRASARLRRRATLLGVVAAIAAAVAAIVVLIPEKSPQATHGPSGPPVAPHVSIDLAPPHLTAVDRRQINATLDRFVPAALLGKSALVAWRLAGPELKSGSTLAQWRAGTTPVPYFPAKETRFHDWTTIEVERGSAVLNLLLHPKAGTKLSPTVFSIQVVRHGGHWLVNRWYTIAVMSPQEVGPADFASAPPVRNGVDHGTVRRWWIIPALALFSLIPLGLLAFAARALVRARRWKRDARASGRNAIPVLPRRDRAA